jgi:hypothetical protein
MRRTREFNVKQIGRNQLVFELEVLGRTVYKQKFVALTFKRGGWEQ